jgi:hypothetical protein
MEAADEAAEAPEIVQTALKASTAAVEFELVSSGATIAEPSTPTQTKAWA